MPQQLEVAIRHSLAAQCRNRLAWVRCSSSSSPAGTC